MVFRDQQYIDFCNRTIVKRLVVMLVALLIAFAYKAMPGPANLDNFLTKHERRNLGGL